MEGQEEDSLAEVAAICGPDEIVKLNSPGTSPTILPENWEVILRDLPSRDFLSAINSSAQWNEERLGLKQTESLYPKLSKLSTILDNTRDLSFWKFVQVSCANLEELHLRVGIHDRLLAVDEINLQGAFQPLKKLSKIVVKFIDKPKVVIRNPANK